MAECALIVPLYRNAGNVPALLERLAQIHAAVPGGVEAVCVVDGSPDDCHALLAAALPRMPFASRLLLLSRNFGSFPAIRAGLAATPAAQLAVMAADLQEPAELIVEFFRVLREEPVDVAVGTRIVRADALAARLGAGLFWGLYRRFVQRELPRGGIDVFACNRAFRDHLLRFTESNSSLVGQLLWLGFRRREVPYERQAREVGRSAWTLRRKLRYLMDSVFSFSDLPIRAFLALGGAGLAAAAVFAVVVVAARLAGWFEVPGYAATVITVLFFSGLNLFGLGIIGSYVWRAYENTKARPLSVVMREDTFDPRSQ